MKPARTQMDRFGFPPISSVSARLAIALVVASIFYGIVKESLGIWLLFTPGMLLQKFAVWQPLTYTLIETHPTRVLFGALVIWSIGGSLEKAWGTRRYLAFAFSIPALAALLTALLGLAIPALYSVPYSGGWVMAGALWVAFGLWIGKGQSSFFMIPMTGNMLALIGAVMLILTAALVHWTLVIPEAFALAMAAAYVKGYRPRVLWLKLQAWRLSRQLKSRAKHLRVVEDDQRNMPRDSDRFLH